MKKFISLALISMVLHGCGGTKKLEREDYVKTCEVECFYLATGLISVQDYENAEKALITAREHHKDRERLDAPQSESEWIARRYQLALAEVVVAHRNKGDLKSKWRVLGDAIQEIVDSDEYQTVRLAASDFVPKRDRKWFETALAKQSHPALQGYGGLVLIDWKGTLPERWVAEPSDKVKLADLYIASQSVIDQKLFLERFSAYVAARVGTIEDGSIDDLLESEKVMTKFFSIVTPEYLETLKIVAETAERRGYSHEVMPLPGQAIPALQGCEIVEKLIGFKTVRKGRDAEGLSELAECLIRLGRGSFASNVISQMDALDPGSQEAKRLHVHNHIINGWATSKVSDKILASDTDLKLIENAQRKRRFTVLTAALKTAKDPVARRLFTAYDRRARHQFSSALQDARGLLGDYRSTQIAWLAVMTNGYTAREDIRPLLQGIKEKNEGHYWRLMLTDAWTKADHAKTVEYAEELMALDKQGDCDDVTSALWSVMLADKDLAWQRFEDWNRWLRTRQSSSCRRAVSLLLYRFHPEPSKRFKEIYPNDDMGWTSRDDFCPAYEEAAALKELEEADKSDEDAYDSLVNSYVWCRVLAGKSTPKYHDILKAHKLASFVDTYGWSLYRGGDIKGAVKAWQSIDADEMPVISDVGAYAGLAATSTDAEFEKQWEEIRGESHVGGTSAWALVVWADALAAAGKSERARRVYEHVAVFGNRYHPLPEIETKCPTCRPAFKAFWGHENRFWKPDAFHPGTTTVTESDDPQPDAEETTN